MPARSSPGGPDKRGRQRDAASTRAEEARARARRQRRRRVATAVSAGLALAAVVVLAGVGLSRAGRGDPGARAAFDGSTRTLDFELPAFAGGTVSSADLRGRPAIVNFYASWCTVCDTELPDFQAVHEQAGDAITFLGVNPQSNDSDNAQAAMIKRTGIRFRTVRDRNDHLLRLFNTTGALPTTLFLDAQGRVVGTHNGGLDQTSLKAAIKQYLGVAV